MPTAPDLALANAADPALENNLIEVLDGLSLRQKQLSPKWFYDQRGSELFEAICELPEYYPTRTELAIMDANGANMAELIGPNVSVIEFGAGSNLKIRRLLDLLIDPVAYVPVDISGEYLESMAANLAPDYPNVEVLPILADFTAPFDLPNPKITPLRNLVYFPGSTIGNFSPAEALNLLQVMAGEAKPGGALLIGVDLKKDPAILNAAYNDAEGVTAEFNLNMLVRLNKELGANFDIEQFRHYAFYNKSAGRIEMHLVSLRDQRVSLGGQTIRFMEGEPIITEYSYKFSLADFAALASKAGFQHVKAWLDPDQLFSVQLFSVP